MSNFKGVSGKKYDESLVGYPNYHIFQGAIKFEIKKYLKTNNNKKIRILEAGCGTGETSKLILDSS